MSRARRTQELLYNVTGQSLIFDCEDGRPSSVTSVQVWPAHDDDTATAETATTGSASVETSPNTTIATAAVGPAQADPTAMVVASGTGFAVGRRFLITEDGTGVNEFFEVASVSGTSIKAKHPLRNDYSVGSLVQSTRVSISVDSTWIADLSNISPTFSPNPGYRVRWVLVVNGNTVAYQMGLDVVRYPVNHGVTPLDVDQAHPGWIDRLPPDYQVDHGRGLIEAAFESVKFELYGDDKADQAVRNPELLARLVIDRCPVEMLQANAMRGAGNAEALDTANRIWRQRYDQTLRAPVAAMDPTGGGGAVTVTPAPLWRR